MELGKKFKDDGPFYISQLRGLFSMANRNLEYLEWKVERGASRSNVVRGTYYEERKKILDKYSEAVRSIIFPSSVRGNACPIAMTNCHYRTIITSLIPGGKLLTT